MAYTLADYTALCAAIAQGALSVEYADKKVQFRTLSEMYQIKRDMEKGLGSSNSGKPARKFASFSKGLNG
jgi:hypothetical protein